MTGSSFWGALGWASAGMLSCIEILVAELVVIVILAVIGFDLLLKASVLALFSPLVALCLRAFHAVVCLFVLLVEVEMVINRQLEGEVETTERLMAAVDIYSFFGNALDNALEAIGALPDDAMRSISLLVRRQAGMASIHMENFCAPEAHLDFEGGLPQTTKSDRMSHGFGTRSMRATAARYGGTIVFSNDGGTFCLDVLLPLPQPAPAT